MNSVRSFKTLFLVSGGVSKITLFSATINILVVWQSSSVPCSLNMYSFIIQIHLLSDYIEWISSRHLTLFFQYHLIVHIQSLSHNNLCFQLLMHFCTHPLLFHHKAREQFIITWSLRPIENFPWYRYSHSFIIAVLKLYFIKLQTNSQGTIIIIVVCSI